MYLLKSNAINLAPFWTVLTGVIVFVLSQLFIEFILRPIQEYKKLKSDVSWALTYYANIYSNPTGVKQELYDEASKELRKLAAELRAFNIRKPKLLYKKDKIDIAASDLIGLANCVGSKFHKVIVDNYVKGIKKSLGFADEKEPVKK